MPAMLASDPTRQEILKRARLLVNRDSTARRTLEPIPLLMTVVNAENGFFAMLLALEDARAVGALSGSTLITH
ncbi:MAG: hypothetical protein WBV55_08450 [Candidatus Sulfotelmatobacter sp.]